MFWVTTCHDVYIAGCVNGELLASD